MAYIQLYKASDDSLVSESPETSNSVEISLRADLGEEKEVRLYLKSKEGYTHNDVKVEPIGDTAVKWSLARDASGSSDVYGEEGKTLTIGKVNDTSKTYFWIKAKASKEELPKKDISVSLQVTGIVSVR